MLKNKKKLRRMERNTPGYAVKTAQSLVLAGALVLGGAGMASAVDFDLANLPTVGANHGTGELVSAAATAITWDATANKFIIHAGDVTSKTGAGSNLVINGGLDIGTASENAKLTLGFTGEAHTFIIGATAAANNAGSNGVLSIKSGSELVVGVTTSTSMALQVGSDGNGHDATSNVGQAGGLGTWNHDGKLTLNSVGTPSLTIGGKGGTGNTGNLGLAGGLGGNGILNFNAGSITASDDSVLQVGGSGGTGGGGAAANNAGGAGGAGGIGTLEAKGTTELSIGNSTAVIGGLGGNGGNAQVTANSGDGGIGGAGTLNVAANATLTIKSTHANAGLQIGGKGGNGGTVATIGDKGDGGTGNLKVVADGTLNLVTDTTVLGITLGGEGGSTGTNAGTIGTGTANIAGTMNVSGASAVTLTINNNAANSTGLTIDGGTLNVGTAAATGVVAKHGLLTLAGNGNSLLVNNGGVVNVTSNAANTSSLEAVTSVMDGQLNLIGTTNGSTHTGAVTLNGNNAVLNAVGGATATKNTLSAGLTFGANGGTVNVGDADNAGFLTVTSPLTIANGGVVNVDNGSTLTSATSLTKGSLNLIDGSTHDGNVTLNGSAGNAAMVEVAGGTVAKPNAITGALLTNGAASEGIVTVGTAGAGNEAVLTVSAASTLGDNAGAAGTRVTMNVAKGSTAAFTSAASGLIIDKGAEVTASSYKNTATLAGNTGLLVANNGVTVNNGGVLNILGDHIFNSATANTTMVLTSGTLRVAGELSNGNALAADQTLVAQKYKSTAANGDTLTGGTLKLVGTGDVNAKVLTVSTGTVFGVSGGALNLGGTAADLTGMGLASDYNQGGTIDKNVTLTAGGAMNVQGGDWTISNAGNGSLSINATDANVATRGLHVKAGSLTVDKIDLVGNGQAVVGTGTAIAKLIVGGTAQGSLKMAANQATNTGMTVKNLGQLHVQQSALFNGGVAIDATNVKNSTVESGGMLVITGIAANSALTLQQMSAAKTALLGSSTGLVNFGAIGITGLADVPAYADVAGLMSDQLVKKTVTITTDNAAAGIAGGFKNLTFDTKLVTNQDLAVNSTLILAGAGVGTDLVGNHGGFDVSMNVANNTALTFGLDTVRSGGTLNGTVLLANTGSIFNVVNGDFKLTGILDSTTAGSKVNLVDSSLQVAGTIGAANVSNVSLIGATLSGGDEVKLGTVVLDGGVLAAINQDKTGTKGDLTTGAVTITGEGNFIGAGNNLKIDSFTDGTATGAGKISNAIIAAGNNMSVTAAGSNLTAKGVTLNVQGTLSTNGNAATNGAITAGEGSHFNVGTLSQAGTTGNVTVSGASSLVVTTLTGDAANTITIGTLDKTDGSVLVATNTTLGGGSLSVLNAKASLGTLDASTGTIFVDPAYVNIDGVTGTFGAALLAGAGGQVTLGNLNEAWVQKAIMESGAAADSSVLGLQKSLVLDGNGTIVVDKDVKSTGFIGTAAAAPTQKVYFGNKSLLAIDGSQFLDPTKVAIVGAGQAVFTQNTGDNQALLHIANVKTNDVVHVLGGVTGVSLAANSTSAWLDENISFDTQLFFGEGWTNAANTVYNVDVKTHGATTIFPKLSNSMGGLVDNVMAQYGLQTESDNAGVRFVSRAVSDSFGLGGNNATKAAATIEGAAQMAAVAGVQVSTIGAASVASGAVTTRTSFAQPLMDMTKAVAVHQDNDGALSLDTGLNAGNGMKNGLGVWIMPLYQSNKTWGQKAENFKSGMNSDLGGIALGADYTINDMFRFGAAFNVGAGYGQSTGDFNKTENRFNFWGVNLYGGWTMNNFGLSADVGYTSTFNAVKQDTPASLQMGNLKSDVTSSALQAGLKAEYKLETSVVDIIPHVGVRYMGLATDGYDVKSHGTVFSVERDFQSIWTFPIGVAFSKTITSDSGWMFKPMVDLSVVPAAGDIKAKSKTSIPGVGGQAEMKMQVVDTVTFDGGLGFEVGKDNLSFGLNYNVQASEHRTGHGVFGTLRYEF